MTDPLEEYLAKKTAPAGDEGGDPLAAYLASKSAPAEPPPPAAAKPPGFFSRAATSIAHGLGSLKTVASEQVPLMLQAATSPVETFGTPEGRAHFADTSILTNPSKRREYVRGVDDVATLGYGQKLAAKVGNALGDEKRGTSLSGTAEADAQAAPAYRAAGNVGGLALPANAASEVMGVAGRVGGAVAERVAPKLVAKGLGYISKIPALVREPLKAVAGYESVAPAAAAASADASGHRLEAAKAAATDPGGLVLSGAAGVASAAKGGVLNSKGGKARALIDSERSGGAHAGLLTPGKGGVFDQELAGLGTDDAATGRASQIGGRGIVSHLEEQHQGEHGYGYREGPDMVAKARDDRTRTISEGEQSYRSAAEASAAERAAVRDESRLHADAKAPALLDTIAEKKKGMASEPYRVLAEQADAKGSPGRDATELVTHMQEAVRDLGTSDRATAILQAQLAKLDHYRDPTTGAVTLNERELNALRGKLMRIAKVGDGDNVAVADMPLRKAAMLAKEMVDQGPYGPINKLFAQGAQEAETSRKALGLKGKPAKFRADDEKRLKNTLLRSVKDPTALPAGAPEDASMAAFRERLSAADKAQADARASAAAAKQAALASEAETSARVDKGTAAAVPDRQLLGLNENIGQRAVDENQVRIALDRQIGNTTTAGANKAKLGEFRAKHPDQGRNIDLPVLQNAKNDLAFRLKPRHGGLMERSAGDIAPAAGLALTAAHHPLAAALLAASQNKAPIAGRVLYRPAKAIPEAAASGRAIGIAAPFLGQKVKRAIEARQQEQGR